VIDLPTGAVFIDLLAPEGTSQRVEDLQTRLDLIGDGDWRVIADDGTMEASAVPMQPLRGEDERLWVCRSHPFTPTDNLQVAASLAVEVSGMCQARLAAVGVCGLYSWGFVLVEDFHNLYGLLLLDWLYNPRVSATGEVLDSDEPAVIETEMRAKAAMFSQLWTPEASRLLMSQLPPGVLQQVESYQALSLLGPGGRFDPRLWQGLAMQLVLPAVQFLGAGASAASALPEDGSAFGSAQGAPAIHSGPSSGAPVIGASTNGGSSMESAPAPAGDGLTPLARAQLEAERRRISGEDLEVDERTQDEAAVAGVPVCWRETEEGLVLWVPVQRFDADLLRSLQGGDFGLLDRAERPSAEKQETWLSGGSPFVTELPSFSRLFLEGVPLHRSAFESAARQEEDAQVLFCHLPRVCRVLAVVVAGEDPSGPRILVSSSQELAPAQVLHLAGP